MVLILRARVVLMDLIAVIIIYPLAYHSSIRHRFDFASQEIPLLIQIFAKMHQRFDL